MTPSEFAKKKSMSGRASIPLALADAVADRRIKRGDLLLLEAMGGGFTWATALLRWRDRRGSPYLG